MRVKVEVESCPESRQVGSQMQIGYFSKMVQEMRIKNERKQKLLGDHVAARLRIVVNTVAGGLLSDQEVELKYKYPVLSGREYGVMKQIS